MWLPVGVVCVGVINVQSLLIHIKCSCKCGTCISCANSVCGIECVNSTVSVEINERGLLKTS